MDRQQFIRTVGLISGVLALNPAELFGSVLGSKNLYTEDELTGKAKIKLVGDGVNLREEAAKAFQNMKSAAACEGIDLYSVSSYRSFDRQKAIWNRKFQRFVGRGMSGALAVQEIIKYSTMPGTSRHHWGTDLDIIDLKPARQSDPLNERHFQKGGAYEKLHMWLTECSASFGFYMTYTNVKERKGFSYEPWHFSYKPLALGMLKEYKEINLKKLVDENQLLGREYLTQEFLQKYRKENVLDINPVLLP